VGYARYHCARPAGTGTVHLSKRCWLVAINEQSGMVTAARSSQAASRPVFVHHPARSAYRGCTAVLILGMLLGTWLHPGTNSLGWVDLGSL
jgi:hypothetical protein